MKQDKLIIYPKKAKGEVGYKTFSVRIKEETVKKLEKLVSETGYSRNELIGILLEFSLNNCYIDKNE